MYATDNLSSQRSMRSRIAILQWSLTAAFFIAFGLFSETHAIIVPSGSANTTDPGTGVPWDNVIQVNGNSDASGVYLGGGWVITAAHVGYPSDVTIDGTTYTTDSDCLFPLTNAGWDPDGSDTMLPPDLVLFRLDSAPSPDMNLTYGGLSEGDANITMIGYGPTDQTTGVGTKSWGMNDIETFPGVATHALIETGSTPDWDTVSLFTDFDMGTTNEAQAEVGDSGGGAFYQDGSGNWVLGGVIFAVGTDTDTGIQNTFIADLDEYDIGVNGISGIMQSHGSVPEPNSCVLSLFGTLVLLILCRKRRIGR